MGKLETVLTIVVIRVEPGQMLGNCEIYPKLLLFVSVYKGHKSAGVWRNIKSNAYYFTETVSEGTVP